MKIIRKKYFMCLVFMISASMVFAQFKQAPKNVKVFDWHLKSYTVDAVYGASIEAAYALMASEKVKKKPIVAMIGYGVDVEHEDLRDNIWHNPKFSKVTEIPEGNFKMDLHGWNFLGNAKGENLAVTNKIADREYERLKGEYEHILFNGTQYLRFEAGDTKPTVMPLDFNAAVYNYYRKSVVPNSAIAQYSYSTSGSLMSQYYYENDFKTLISRFSQDEDKLTIDDFKNLYEFEEIKQDSLRTMAAVIVALHMSIGQQMAKDAPALTYGNFKKLYLKNLEKREAGYEALVVKSASNRVLVGDDYPDLKKTNYGNNELMLNIPFYSTTSAGIIAAARNNDLGVNGIVDADLMIIRAYPKEGDPYLKDLALAIRYAVDHKADIINLSMPVGFYPEQEGKMLDDALIYAEKKGVLIVAPVWDASMELSKTNSYPNRFLLNGKELKNFITVAASDSTGSPLKTSNYGPELLDVYAPGVNLSTTYLGDSYRVSSSSLVASATVSGVAALIKSYYPKLTATDLRTIILQSVTKRDRAEVLKTVKKGRSTVDDLYYLSDLAQSAGIINAEQALQLAAVYVENKK